MWEGKQSYLSVFVCTYKGVLFVEGVESGKEWKHCIYRVRDPANTPLSYLPTGPRGVTNTTLPCLTGQSPATDSGDWRSRPTRLLTLTENCEWRERVGGGRQNRGEIGMVTAR